MRAGAELDNDEKDIIKTKKRERMAEIRSRMTEDQKDDIKDADRKRKTKVVSKERKTFYLENEREFMMKVFVLVH